MVDRSGREPLVSHGQGVQSLSHLAAHIDFYITHYFILYALSYNVAPSDIIANLDVVLFYKREIIVLSSCPYKMITPTPDYINLILPLLL